MIHLFLSTAVLLWSQIALGSQDINWLQELNKPENAEMKTEAIERLSQYPTAEETQRKKSLVEKEWKFSEKKQIGPDETVPGLLPCTVKNFELTGTNPLDESDKNWKVEVQTYRGGLWERAAAEDRYSLVLLPPTGGLSDLDKLYSKFFCLTYSIQVVVVAGWDGDDTIRYESTEEALEKVKLKDLDPKLHDRNAIQNIAAIRYAVQLLNDPHKVAVMGNSVGAIVGSLAIGLIDKIYAGVFIVGGGDIAEIIAESTERKLTVLRGVRSALLGEPGQPLAKEEYKAELRKHIAIEPLNYLSRAKEKRKKFNFVIANNDFMVPSENQWLLRDKAAENNEENVKHFDMDVNHEEAIRRAVSVGGVFFADFIKDSLREERQ